MAPPMLTRTRTSRRKCVSELCMCCRKQHGSFCSPSVVCKRICSGMLVMTAAWAEAHPVCAARLLQHDSMVCNPPGSSSEMHASQHADKCRGRQQRVPCVLLFSRSSACDE